MNNFYTYIYLDPRKPGKYKYDEYKFNYEPFYVGKGKENRINDKKNDHCERKINKIKSKGLEPIRIKLRENLEENYSFELEKELIKLIGKEILKEGPLTNIVDGGEGVGGYKWTEEQFEKSRKKYYIIKKGFEKIDYKLLTEEKNYKNNKQKLEYECPKGHEHSIRWNNFQYGQECPICSKNKKSENMYNVNNHFYGKKHSEKTLKLMSKLQSGKNNGMFGKHHSNESKRKSKESHLGKYIGIKNPNAKLTENDVILIKMTFREFKDITQKELAKIFNIHQTQISKIKLGKIWSHIKLGDINEQIN